MNDFTRIAKEGNLVQITTTKGDVFTGKLLPTYFVIHDGGKVSVEIYLKQDESHAGVSYGVVGLTLQDIENILLI